MRSVYAIGMDDRTIIIRTFEGTVHTESDRLIFIQNGL